MTTIDWVATLQVSHYLFAFLVLFFGAFIHRGYAIKAACYWSGLFYAIGLWVNDPLLGAPGLHWLTYVAMDVALACWISFRLKVAPGAAYALLGCAFLGVMNGLDIWSALFHDRYEPLALTLNLAQVYYLTIQPRRKPRDRRWRDRYRTA